MMPLAHVMSSLAQVSPDVGNQKLMDALKWLGLIFALVVIGGTILLLVRNRIKKKAEEPVEPAGFTLADLRELRDRGELTPEEFESAKTKILAKAKSSLDDRTASLRQAKKRLENGEDRDPTV